MHTRIRILNSLSLSLFYFPLSSSSKKKYISGMGAYHGKHTFDAFSHLKACMVKSAWADVLLRPFRYPKAGRSDSCKNFVFRVTYCVRSRLITLTSLSSKCKYANYITRSWNITRNTHSNTNQLEHRYNTRTVFYPKYRFLD